MAEMLAQLFYRIMRDAGVSGEQLSAHIAECRPEPATFSLPELGAEATELAGDFCTVSIDAAIAEGF